MIRRTRPVVGLVIIVALFGAGLLVASAQTASFSNTQSITIADYGAATPYPSTITVEGMSGQIVDVNVSLAGITHGYPRDIDLLLVGPEGQTVLLMDDVGGEDTVSNVDITFDDAATESLYPGQPLVSGTYKPSTNLIINANCPLTPFPSPAPEGPYGATLSELNSGDPNGIWSLFVQDDCDGDGGSIAGGWSLEIVTDGPSLNVPGDIVVVNDPGQAGAIVNYPAATATDVEDGDTLPAPSCLPAAGTFFPLGETIVTCTVTDSDLNEATDSFTVTVEVESTAEWLAILRSETITRVDNPLYERWMTQMLDVSRFALERGRPEIAQRYLRISDVQLTLGKAIRQISSDDAAELRLLLNQVRDAMS